MNIKLVPEWLRNKLGGKPTKRERTRVSTQIRAMSYAASEMTRLTEDWSSTILSSNASLGNRLRVMRGRSRTLEQDNVYVRGFVKALKRNVLGCEGIKLEMRARDPNGELDKRANQQIEEAWRDWCDNYCDIGERLSWKALCDLILCRTAIDGEGLLEFFNGADNPHGFAVRFLESDHLDETYNKDLSESRFIRMSVEVDQFDRRINYHLLNRHPGETAPAVQRANKHRRVVESAEMIHSMVSERASQYRGVPWLHAAMSELKMLGGYKEAELVAARVAASKAGFIKKSFPDGASYDTDSADKRQIEVEPGIIEELEMGEDFVPWDPTHPNTAFGDFVKAALRGVAGGIGVSYTTLSSDLESVNYSSARVGMLEEREEWKQIQKWMAQTVHRKVFRAWLKNALVNKTVNLPLAKLQKFSTDNWIGRRWQWVDPEKDLRAAQMAVDAGFRSRQDIIDETYGTDFEETLEKLAEEEKAAKEAGVVLKSDANPPQQFAKPPGQPQNGTA